MVLRCPRGGRDVTIAYDFDGGRSLPPASRGIPCDSLDDGNPLLTAAQGPCRPGVKLRLMPAKRGEAPVVDTSSVEYDQKAQLDQVVPWLLDDEKLWVVFDCKGAGTGFIAVTNKRLMFYDKAFLRKRKALTSVPFSKITAVSTVDEGRGLFGTTSELVVRTGSEEFEFEFRGGEKAQRAYKLIMSELLQGELP